MRKQEEIDARTAENSLLETNVSENETMGRMIRLDSRQTVHFMDGSSSPIPLRTRLFSPGTARLAKERSALLLENPRNDLDSMVEARIG